MTSRTFWHILPDMYSCILVDSFLTLCLANILHSSYGDWTHIISIHIMCIWRFPKIRVLPVTIQFNRVFFLIYQPVFGVPPLMETRPGSPRVWVFASEHPSRRRSPAWLRPEDGRLKFGNYSTSRKSKWITPWMNSDIYNHIHTYITLHYITLH